jgi:hypothetical protein
MTLTTTFQVNRQDFSKTNFQYNEITEVSSLQEGQVLMKVDQFSFTANNITYAAIGEALKYWDFFPTAEGKGVIPVWGFADVIASRKDDIAVGERFYGYYPMATHLVVNATAVNAYSFIDGAEHRQNLSVIYNQYLRCSADPTYSKKIEALQMLLRPLFTTSFLLDDLFSDNQFFGADSLVLTSASSKTALGMAFLLHMNRDKRDHQYQIIGLTSATNVDFVKSLSYYDQVLSYDQVTELNNDVATTTIDFAGNGQLLGILHQHFNDNLTYSCRVGASHWDKLNGLPKQLAGPQPQMFFAPTQAAKRVKEWGGVGFQQRIGEVWFEFINFAQQWMTIEEVRGESGINDVYQNALAGKFNPEIGTILSFDDEV